MVINICNILAAKIPSNLKIVNVWQQMNFLLITLGQIKIQQIKCIHYVIKSKEIKIEVFCKMHSAELSISPCSAMLLVPFLF